MPALFPAEIYNKNVAGNDDKTLILATRTQVVIPFSAPNWTDLRIGFFLSLTEETVDDLGVDVIGLAETIAMPAGGFGPENRYWLGVKDRGTALPKNPTSVFVGYSNATAEDATIEHTGASVMANTDINIGTATNLWYWHPSNGSRFMNSGGIWQGFHNRAISTDGVQQHFPKKIGVGFAPGYATLLALKITRPNKDSKTLTVKVPKIDWPPPGGIIRSADIMFTDTPTTDILLTTLRNFPATTQQWGPSNVATVPDALYFYWPFNQSRLRIHAYGIFSHQ